VAGKTPQEAASNFVHFLRETLSCVSDHYLSAFQQSSKLYKVFYEPYAPIKTRDGKQYQLSITQIFRVMSHPELAAQFKASTQEYSYRLLIGPGEHSEVLAYHWHPQEPGVHYPHVHIAQAHKIHFPTSRVCLEDFVYLLMRDYNIKPKLSHAACNEILQRNKRAFEKMATWKIQSP
jgi:hypothetical protein